MILSWELYFIKINLWNDIHFIPKIFALGSVGSKWWLWTYHNFYSVWVNQLNFSSQIQSLNITETRLFLLLPELVLLTFRLSFIYLVSFKMYLFFLRDFFCFLVSSAQFLNYVCKIFHLSFPMFLPYMCTDSLFFLWKKKKNP